MKSMSLVKWKGKLAPRPNSSYSLRINTTDLGGSHDLYQNENFGCQTLPDSELLTTKYVEGVSFTSTLLNVRSTL